MKRIVAIVLCLSLVLTLGAHGEVNAATLNNKKFMKKAVNYFKSRSFDISERKARIITANEFDYDTGFSLTYFVESFSTKKKTNKVYKKYLKLHTKHKNALVIIKYKNGVTYITDIGSGPGYTYGMMKKNLKTKRIYSSWISFVRKQSSKRIRKIRKAQLKTIKRLNRL